MSESAGRKRKRRTPTQACVAGQIRAREAGLKFGHRVKNARKLRHLTQRDLAARVGITQGHQSNIERGEAANASLLIWFAQAAALDIPLRIELGRDPLEKPDDAGHLDIQELVLRLGRSVGLAGTFELATRPSNPAYSSDVGLRDDQRRVLLLIECWNTFGSINASVRSTHRKIAEAEALAVALGGPDGPYRVACCWVVRDTRRNREIVGRYPEVFNSTFTASSGAWVRTLTQGDEPPSGLGLIWCDLAARSVFAWRRKVAGC